MTSMWAELLRMVRNTISLFDTPTEIKRYDTLVNLAGSYNASRSWAANMHPELISRLPAAIDIAAELDAKQPRLDHMAIVMRFKNLSSTLQATAQ
jgi:hypothetical protein